MSICCACVGYVVDVDCQPHDEPMMHEKTFVLQLMASGIYQRGEEDEGVHGFLVDDIVKEVHRASKLVCHCVFLSVTVETSPFLHLHIPPHIKLHGVKLSVL